ncbi:MAG: hypothetical protein JWM78_3429 [Verrucomicrobiaceae bacterium]|nr:hypothetical protein [Verrucomicrobiaceae bacterium]
MRLNGWQRFGIFLSIVWVISAVFHQHNEDFAQAQSFASLAFKACANSKYLDRSPDLSQCESEKTGNINVFMKDDVGNALLIALLPLPFAWIAAYVIEGLSRALIIGLPVVLPWRLMSRPRKAFVLSGMLLSGIASLFGLLSLLNFYTDTFTPVVLSPFRDVIDFNDDTVVAEGTWTREGSLGSGSKMDYPLQTSKITCTKSDQHCVESRAAVSGNLLSVNQIDYEIDSWSPTIIVFSNETLCARETFTIDRKTKAVNGIGRWLITNDKFCLMGSTAHMSESSWEFHLEEGFKIYWAERQKSRPAPLRIIQAFFGN